MKTITLVRAMKLAGGREQLAKLLGCASISTYRWQVAIPQARVFQLMAIRPDWCKRGGK